MAKKFERQNSIDLEISEDGKTAAKLRIKPNSLLVKEKGEQTYMAVPMEKIIAFVKENGEKKKQ